MVHSPGRGRRRERSERRGSPASVRVGDPEGSPRRSERMNTEQDVVDALSGVWSSMQQLGDTLDETQWKLPTDCPGWSVQDNLAHIVGIESVIMGLPEPAVD